MDNHPDSHHPKSPATEPALPAPDRIRWQDDEEAAVAAKPRPHLPRIASTDSLAATAARSVRSLSRRNSVDAAAALPVQYRTISIDVDDYNRQQQQQQNLKKKHATTVAATAVAELEWHTISVDEVLRRLSTTADHGLSADQVRRRIALHGRNAPSDPPTHRVRQIAGYFFKGFGPILLVASVLVFVAWRPLGDPPAPANLALAIVLLAVFFIQAAFNMWQDWSSSRVMASVKTMLPDRCLVVRDGGKTLSLPAEELVPGDILSIRAGNKLPADVRFIAASSDARFDRSILTGESVPLGATVDSTDDNYLETRCIGLQGTHCVSGACTGVVVATGDSTIFGRIASLAGEPKRGLTSLEREVLHFVLVICGAMIFVIVAVVVVWAAWLRREHPGWISVAGLIVSCVSVAVAFIPEGLPVAVTASMTISANMMRRSKILCKSLKTVESLGSVSVVCSDKTGTLTQNRMTVLDCAVGRSHITVRRARECLDEGHTAIGQLRAVAGLCNAAHFDVAGTHLPIEERPVFGDATDQAILRFSETLGPVTELQEKWSTRYELAFNSKNKYMIKAFGLARPNGRNLALSAEEEEAFDLTDLLLTVKGAPEILLGRAGSYVDDEGHTREMDDTARLAFEMTKDEWSSNGRRVILLARKVVSHTSLPGETGSAAFENAMNEQAKSGLTVVGLVGIVDPPRPEIPEVVRTLRGAGIRVFMVTGDFALTAQAIAAECGIITSAPSQIDTVAALVNCKETTDSPKAIVLSGPELITLNSAQWDRLVAYAEIVFARTTPEQKLRIVRELQSRGQRVGMTGDGVNDAPSLRAADVGIAVGSGSDVAIEAADMVLLDSFSSIVDALRFGRMMFDNLRKTVAYLLPAGSFSEFWPVIANVMFGLPQILSSFLMIMICLFTDSAAAIALAYEAPEADVLTRPPRVPGRDRLVDWRLVLQAYGFVGVLETLSSFAMAFWYLERRGIPFSKLWFSFGDPKGVDPDYYHAQLDVASSIYFVNLVVMQWFNLLAVRTRRLSLFQQPPLFDRRTRNVYLFPAILFALAVAFFWLYVPEFQRVLGTAEVPVEYWFLPMTFGLGVLGIDEARKFAVRKWPGGVLVRMAW